ncbi:MAG: 30S ribosomal protein S6 [Candidatus Levybacteria bacterium]|nr:30S ribosomal protein S6 [Candidatus Levybacteria bacterium]
MRLYELVLVLKTSLSETERKKVLAQIKEWLGDAKITKEDEWGQKPLAYKIKRELAGFYHKMDLESENAIPHDLETRILRSENVLRHLLIRTK